MPVPLTAYAVRYSVAVNDSSGPDPVDFGFEQTFELSVSLGTAVVEVEDAAAAAAVDAWKTSVESSLPGASVVAVRQYLTREVMDAWPW